MGTLAIKRADLTKKISNLGGLYVPKVSADTFVVISDEKRIAQRPVTLEMAEACKVHVVSVSFINDLEEKKAEIKSQQDLIDLVERCKINPWTASNVLERILLNKAENEALADTAGLSSTEQHKAEERMRNQKWNSATEAKMKVLVKNGGVVDPDADLDEETHSVLRENGILYSFVLAKSNVADGTNSYYKMQIIKRDSREVYYLFRAWGRIGTVIGGNKCDEMDKDEAVESFEFHFLDKTGNHWKDKDHFVKQHDKYFQLQLDYGPEEAEEEYAVQPGSKTLLAKPIQDLIKMIFDVEAMRKTMKEFEIDSRKMPLGKLSKKQIVEAMAVLAELQTLVDGGERPNAPKIIGATNRFFTLIPHDFGVHTPPILNQSALLKDKLDMLENLLEIEVAFNILRGENRSSDKDPIDQKYEKLKCDLEVLDKGTEEYQQIAAYIANTHAATHSDYQLQLVDVFKVARQGEAERFQEFRSLHNHKLLWHGSRVTNYAGILSQGLRIAPPEAPVTGYMFGKGVYFADMVSKSANYCATSPTSPTGLMLLSDVALGNMYERTAAKSITRLPKDFHSVKGCGRTEPDPKQTITTEDGVEIPMGHPKDAGLANSAHSSLLYNEYIVYNEAQVNIRYLLKVKFQYK
ncbi:hypothetical protein RvY_05505 [Ramazzottius varieornatus]|uniref:Poly [ADP-ribose] polymerase n=1 Tax=Ramazzottius varieornatus TaxID=947166 RepID=A0A1D1V496_RAMVA|nr:hypothetical protein RvY_05505 [Ramazzottius varieornatus]